jgi:UDP-glucose 4-epimerase
VKILITGGAGFLSSHLIPFLEKKDGVNEIYSIESQNTKFINKYESKVIEYYCDISYMPSVVEMFKQFQPDVIIHTAALSTPNIPEVRWTDFSHINICGTHYLAHYAPKGCKFIFLSSIVVHGDSKDQKLEQPTSLYGVSKLAGEKILNYYDQTGRIKAHSLRCCAMTGSGLTHGVLKDFIVKAQNNDPIFEILGNKPGSIKPYIHVDEVVKCIWTQINHNFGTEIKVSPKDNISIDEIANIVLEKCGKKKEKKWIGKNFVGDNPIILVEQPQYIPKMNSKEAIEKAIDEILCKTAN